MYYIHYVYTILFSLILFCKVMFFLLVFIHYVYALLILSMFTDLNKFEEMEGCNGGVGDLIQITYK